MFIQTSMTKGSKTLPPDHATNEESLVDRKPPVPKTGGDSLVDRLYAPMPVKGIATGSYRGRPTVETVLNNVRRPAKVILVSDAPKSSISIQHTNLPLLLGLRSISTNHQCSVAVAIVQYE